MEIGPLNAPFVGKGDADVRYVDVQPSELLRQVYAPHPGFDATSIVEVDHWLIADDGKVSSLAEATAASGLFDWAVASHVIEHVPDLVGWLVEVAAVLVDGGLLSLVIPDRRFTFDAARAPTTIGQLLQASNDRDVRPSVRAVFDTNYYARRVPPKDKWTDDAVIDAPPVHPPLYIREQLELARAGQIYLDAHVWVWTPREFIEQLAALAELGLLEFTVRSVIPTPDNDIEFYVTLERLARNLDAEQVSRALTASYESTLASLDIRPDVERLDPEPMTPSFPVSAAERKMILIKRAVMNRARAAAGYLQRRRGGRD